jgi:Spy/CpxP family protein refolding chaperone
MKRPITTLLLGALLGGGLTLTGPSLANHPSGGAPGWGGVPFAHGALSEERIDRMSRRLHLSQEQKTAVRAIVDKARPQLRALRDRLGEGRRALRALADKAPLDEQALHTLADSEGQAMADLIVLGTQMWSQIREVLTPEQREALQKQLRQRWGHWGHWGRRD